jgi:hypothetical protein
MNNLKVSAQLNKGQSEDWEEEMYLSQMVETA